MWKINIRLSLILLILVVFSLGLCSPKKEDVKIAEIKEETMFSLLVSEKTGIDFVNKVVNQKNFNIFKYRNFHNGGSVAIGDINNDGLPDISLTGNMVPNKLYLNKGNLKFEDISEAAGV